MTGEQHTRDPCSENAAPVLKNGNTSWYIAPGEFVIKWKKKNNTTLSDPFQKFLLKNRKIRGSIDTSSTHTSPFTFLAWHSNKKWQG